MNQLRRKRFTYRSTDCEYVCVCVENGKKKKKKRKNETRKRLAKKMLGV